jgi:predicted HAD superfamily Cof-like phosphohydrolase
LEVILQNNLIQSYLEFHNKFGFSCPEKFTIPKEEIVKVRLNFLLEELKETATAFGYQLYSEQSILSPNNPYFKRNKNLHIDYLGIVDGLIDLEYVVLGTAAFCGLLTQMAGKGMTELKNLQEIR